MNARTKSGDDTLLHLVVERIDVKESFPLVLKLLEYSPDLQIRNRVCHLAIILPSLSEAYILIHTYNPY